MKSIIRVLSVVCVLSCSAANCFSAQPNIVLIMADDLGYETVGADGGTSYSTPVLDRLAATGRASPIVSPSPFVRRPAAS